MSNVNNNKIHSNKIAKLQNENRYSAKRIDVDAYKPLKE